MKTELILYKQQLADNPKFSIQPDYGWVYTGNGGIDWNKEINKITKIPGVGRTLTQKNKLIEGVQYQVRFNVSGRTTGTLLFKNYPGGSTHVNASGNALHDYVFTSDGVDLLFETGSTFDGSISNFSITEYPVMFSIDLTEDVAISLNFNIDNIFKVNERKTNYSKTVVLQGTHNNNIALNHLYKINSEGYDPNKPCRVIVLNDGITGFDGVFYINKVDKTIQFGTEDIRYEGVMYGELTNIVDRFQDRTIKDLDFSRWDHPFSLRNILVSWNSMLGGGPYSLVQGLPNVFDNSTGLYYQNQQIIDGGWGISITSYSYQGFLRVQIETSVPHNFVEGDYLHIESENSMVSGSQTVAFVPDNTHIVLTMLYSNLANNAFTNISIQKREWDALGYYYPMIDNASYQKVCINGDESSGMITVGKLYTVKYLSINDDLSSIARDPLNPANPITLKAGVTFYAYDGFSIINNQISAGTWNSGTELHTYQIKQNGAKLFSKESVPNHWYNTDFIPHIFIREVWNKMFSLIDYYYDCPLIDTTTFRRLIIPMDQNINTIDYIINPFMPVPDPPTPDQMVYMNNWLPQMKLSDFFFSICNLFNLVIIEDKDQNNLIRLVSRNDFFNGDETTLRLDTSQPLEIKLSNSYLPSAYHLKYKDGSDFYNEQYNKEFGNITNENGITNVIDRKYGDHYLLTANKISKEVTKVELEFTPTVLVGNNIYRDSRYAGGSPFNKGNDKTISATFNADENGQNASRKVTNRILVAGIRGTTYPWTISSVVAGVQDENLDVRNVYDGRWFPYAGHIENVLDPYPNYDLNFGTLLGQFFPNIYSISQWETTTRHGEDWERYLLDITDPSGKIVSGTFKISITEIYKLNFQDVFKINGYTLKLNKITDWNINGNGLCKVEFMTKNI